jgi:hypothetical protein
VNFSVNNLFHNIHHGIVLFAYLQAISPSPIMCSTPGTVVTVTAVLNSTISSNVSAITWRNVRGIVLGTGPTLIYPCHAAATSVSLSITDNCNARTLLAIVPKYNTTAIQACTTITSSFAKYTIDSDIDCSLAAGGYKTIIVSANITVSVNLTSSTKTLTKLRFAVTNNAQLELRPSGSIAKESGLWFTGCDTRGLSVLYITIMVTLCAHHVLVRQHACCYDAHIHTLH